MKRTLTAVLLFIMSNSFSQKTLDMTYFSVFGKEKNFQFFNNNEFSYRLKGELLYRTHKLTNMQDSFLVFDNEEIVKLSQIRSIRIKGIKLHKWFYAAGLWFTGLDIAHNLVVSETPIIKGRALMISGIIIGAGTILKYFQDKHVRITKNTVLRIIDSDFQDLNVSK